ncbi:hypothetical protein [Paenibacillus flagellatus]|uniref:Uncharacterized protein n=1 Tax=Paenibacillus flagellatus TaxID=2211139 RepID=A0A2V5KIY1_9BACL|nr:hypothetical protein [Paenibacillus flagellatus]PYI54520.1 hypothetical protein DLM86_13740 [Paenibacillus flagellatus]
MNGRKLATDADLYLAMLFQTPVTVFVRNVAYEPSRGGVIETFDDKHVVVGGSHYARNVCDIREEREKPDR